MIQRLLRRYFARNSTPQQRLVKSIFNKKDFKWVGKYCEWHSAKWPEHEPWYTKPITRFVCWIDDWTVTWSLK